MDNICRMEIDCSTNFFESVAIWTQNGTGIFVINVDGIGYEAGFILFSADQLLLQLTEMVQLIKS